jgi:Spy/CpxP family protein refolding chaperone
LDRVWGSYSEGKRGHERGHFDPARIVEQLTHELALTPEQQRELGSILEETKTKHQAVYDQVRPQFEQVRQEGRARIRSILTPEQLPKFEEWLRRLDEARKKRQAG